MSGPAAYAPKGERMVRVKSFGEALSAVREEAGITFRDLANLVGSTKNECRDWERDIGFPNPNQTQKLFCTFPRLKYFAQAFKKVEGDGQTKASAPEPEPIEKPEPPKTFGEALRRARIKEGMEVEDVASAVDLPVPDMLQNFESGRETLIFQKVYNKLVELFPALADVPKPTTLLPDPIMTFADPSDLSKKKLREIEEAGTRYAIALKKVAEAKIAHISAQQTLDVAKIALDTAMKKVVDAQNNLLRVTGTAQYAKEARGILEL